MVTVADLNQLLYISTVTPNHPVDLDEILRVSRRNNAVCGVTGLLMFNGKRFLQVLEGPGEAITATYARISADQRHRAPVMLARKVLAQREFGDWAMGYRKNVGPEGSELHQSIMSRIENTNPNLRAELAAFARQL